MRLLLLCAALAAAKPAPKKASPPKPETAPATIAAPSAANPAELDVLLQSVQASQRPALQTHVHGLGSLPLYRVVATIDPDTHGFKGQEQLRVPVTVETKELVLRLFNNATYLNAGKPQVAVGKATCPNQSCTLAADTEPTILHVNFDPPLPAGSIAAVDLEFEGTVPQLNEKAVSGAGAMNAQLGMIQSHGGGPTDHGAFGTAQGVMALTGMFPQLAAHFGGQVDLGPPSGIGDVASYDTSNYLFTAEVPANVQVVAGGARVGEEATPSGGKRYTFAAAAVRDFPIYMGNWKLTTEKAGAVTVNAYTLEGDEAQGKVALGVASRALTELGKRLGPYPWTDYSVVEQPLLDGAGGIEYPTVVGFASMVYRSQQSLGALGSLMGPQQKLGSHDPNVGISDKMMEFTVAHETAHQWWSSLIGSDPHRHPAVDEALAQYSAALYVEAKRGKSAGAEALNDMVAINFQMMRMTGEKDGAIDRSTDEFDSPLQYAGLVYGKAPMFYAALRKQLGDATFDKVLRHYADKFRFGEAGPDDFVLAAADVAPDRAKKLLSLKDRWFLESHGDDDVGPLDMGKLVESVTGMKMSPDDKAMMQQMVPQLMQMMQNGVDPSQMLQGP